MMEYDDAKYQVVEDEAAPIEGEAATEQPDAGGEELNDPNVLKIILAAMKVIYDKSTSDQVVNMLRTGDPVQAVANATLFVMRALYETSNKSMPVETALTAADSIVDLMAELAQAAGVEIEAEGTEQAKANVMQTLQQKLGGQPAQQPTQQPAQSPQNQAPAQPGLIAGAMA